jgi:hypothetical protein
MKGNPINSLYSILNRASLASSPAVQLEENLLNKYKDSRVISHIDQNQTLEKSLNVIHGNQNINKNIFNSIGYKNMAGIRLEIKGRLTRRYRADRAISALK